MYTDGLKIWRGGKELCMLTWDRVNWSAKIWGGGAYCYFRFRPPCARYIYQFFEGRIKEALQNKALWIILSDFWGFLQHRYFISDVQKKPCNKDICRVFQLTAVFIEIIYVMYLCWERSENNDNLVWSTKFDLFEVKSKFFFEVSNFWWWNWSTDVSCELLFKDLPIILH